MVSVKGLKGKAFSKEICFGTRVVSLLKRPLCKGSSLLKRLFVKGLNGKALSKGTRFGTGMVSLFKGVVMEKAPCKGISLWKMVYVKGLNGRGLALEQEWFLYGKGPL